MLKDDMEGTKTAKGGVIKTSKKNQNKGLYKQTEKIIVKQKPTFTLRMLRNYFHPRTSWLSW